MTDATAPIPHRGDTKHGWATASRWSARLIGGVGVLMWAFSLIAHTLAGSEDEAIGAEGAAIATLAAVNAVAFIVANRYERWGGAAVVVTGTVFGLFAIATAGHNHWVAALVSGGPFMAAGFLFLLADRLSSDQANSHST